MGFYLDVVSFTSITKPSRPLYSSFPITLTKSPLDKPLFIACEQRFVKKFPFEESIKKTPPFFLIFFSIKQTSNFFFENNYPRSSGFKYST